MIEVIDVLKRDRCLNCNRPVSLLKGDLSRDAHWMHDPVDGVGRYFRHCHETSPVAEPVGGDDTPPPATLTDEQRRAIANCPMPVYHQTHRYCPACPWTEENAP